MKKLLSVLLSAAIIMSMTVPAFAIRGVELENEDILSQEVIDSELGSSWARTELEKAQEAGLMTAHTMTRMTSDITRFQFAELVVNLAEKMTGKTIEPADADTFDDCTETAVLKAYAAGIVDGVNKTSFAPDLTTNREQIATMVARAIKYINTENGVDLAPKAANLDKFTDKNQVSGWAKDGMGLLTANGIMKGANDTTVAPKKPCSIEQSILLVYRIFTKG